MTAKKRLESKQDDQWAREFRFSYEASPKCCATNNHRNEFRLRRARTPSASHLFRRFGNAREHPAVRFFSFIFLFSFTFTPLENPPRTPIRTDLRTRSAASREP